MFEIFIAKITYPHSVIWAVLLGFNVLFHITLFTVRAYIDAGNEVHLLTNITSDLTEIHLFASLLGAVILCVAGGVILFFTLTYKIIVSGEYSLYALLVDSFRSKCPNCGQDNCECR